MVLVVVLPWHIPAQNVFRSRTLQSNRCDVVTLDSVNIGCFTSFYLRLESSPETRPVVFCRLGWLAGRGLVSLSVSVFLSPCTFATKKVTGKDQDQTREMGCDARTDLETFAGWNRCEDKRVGTSSV